MPASGDNPFKESTEIPKRASETPKARKAAPTEQAWQPFTPSGVAAFATTTKGRLLTVQMITGLLAAGVLIWFLQVALFPVAIRSVRALPNEGSIEAGQLITSITSPEPLAKNAFLGIAVDVQERSRPDSVPDFFVKFHKNDLQICCFTGCATIRYPIHQSFYFNRTALESRWGAWMPFILGTVALVVIVGLIAIWSILALIYTPIVRLLGFFQDKRMGFTAAWKLASASQIPGACFQCIAIMLYGLEIIGLIPFCMLFALHLFIGWFFLILAPRALPAIQLEDTETDTNPFNAA